MNERQKTRRERLILDNLCCLCGNEPPMTGARYGIKCSIRRKEQKLRRKLPPLPKRERILSSKTPEPETTFEKPDFDIFAYVPGALDAAIMQAEFDLML